MAYDIFCGVRLSCRVCFGFVISYDKFWRWILWYRTINSPCYYYIYPQTNQNHMPKQIIKCVCVCVCMLVFCVSIKPLENPMGISNWVSHRTSADKINFRRLKSPYDVGGVWVPFSGKPGPSYIRSMGLSRVGFTMVYVKVVIDMDMCHKTDGIRLRKKPKHLDHPWFGQTKSQKYLVIHHPM